MLNGPKNLGAQGAGGAIHSWGGEEIVEGFLKKVALTQGGEGCRVCVKWIPVPEDSALVDQGIGIEAAAGMIPDIGRGITNQDGQVPQSSNRKAPGLGHREA